MKEILNKIIMEDSLFNDENKTFTIRKGIRKYNKTCFLINEKTNKKIKILITSQKISKCSLIDEEYFENLKKYYPNLLKSDDITIIYYSKNKKCNSCNTTKLINQFYNNHYKCKECDKKYLKEHKLKKEKEIFEILKEIEWKI